MNNLEKYILNHLEERGWDNLRPGDVAKSIMIEGAELLEHFQWKNPTRDEVRGDDAMKVEIAEELADVLIYALELSVLLKFDTEKIVMDKLKRVEKKYPADLMKKASDAGNSDLYWKIKAEHRNNT